MSLVRTEITLKNALDVGDEKRGLITDAQVRSLTVDALVDTGAWTLVINEDTCQKLGLELTGTDYATLGDGSSVDCQVTDGVEVHWKNRHTFCTALVIPGVNEVLLGAIPMESMDLIVHPRTEEIVGAHGDKVSHRI